MSYGYAESKCESCNDVASYVDNSSQIVRFLFTTACPLDVEKTVGEDGIIKDEEDIENPATEPEPTDTDTNKSDETNTNEPTKDEGDEKEEEEKDTT